MNRNRNEAKNSKGFYIAVCCCVLVIAIVGYVSWFANNSKPEPENHTDSSYREVSEVPDISDISKLPVKKEEKAPEKKVVPAKEKTSVVAKNIIAEDNVALLSMPIDGKVIGEYSGDKLVFHEKLSDWRSHDGVDFKAKKGEAVAASADGVVESVYSDNMGNCVVIDHENGLKTLYANLEASDLELIGKNVKKGDKIGSVGESALADLSQESHLHFEVLKDGKSADPMEYFKK